MLFCGLPGVGTTALSRRVADQLGATYLRIDTIEAAVISTLASEFGASLHVVQVICSDQDEHRHRVESRGADLPGHHVPTWDQVQRRHWEPIAGPHLVVDNQGDLEQHVTSVLHSLPVLVSQPAGPGPSGGLG